MPVAEHLLALDVYHVMFVMARLGVMIMMIPGLSAPYVSTRLRLGLAMAFSILVLPLLAPFLPPQPETVPQMFLLVAGEVTVGVFVWIVLQMLVGASHLAGTVIGFTSGMANAMTFDPISEQQSAMVVGFLANIAILLLFVTDLHHLVFQAVVNSYTLFAPGQPLLTGDIMRLSSEVVDRSFMMGIQMAAPFLFGSLIFQSGLGLMARLMPQMNVFFVALPLQLLLSLALFGLIIPPVMMVFLTFFRDGLLVFLLPE
ncbi:MAG: flagellar biosynthetic protein FliR [Rhodospirillaceae bacterium]|nr:MAG: flagellar biosynthetic protein FliR [Rhodospirillaceae bacterium]